MDNIPIRFGMRPPLWIARPSRATNRPMKSTRTWISLRSWTGKPRAGARPARGFLQEQLLSSRHPHYPQSLNLLSELTQGRKFRHEDPLLRAKLDDDPPRFRLDHLPHP